MSLAAILDISGWELRDDEPQGKNEKSWYREPGREAGAERDWLFKPAPRKPGAMPDGREWAEKLAELIAVELLVPVAPVEQAVHNGVLGTVCLNVNPASQPIQSGAALLSAVDSDFNPRARDSSGHSPQAIHYVLGKVRKPLTFEGPRAFTSYDVFCGYLVLDALIANQDRHSQNWSVITVEGARHLMETYDHGSSFGAGMKDERRELLLSDDNAFEGFLRRGKASRFEAGKETSLRDFANGALMLASAGAREYWLDRVVLLNDENLERLVAETPGMTVAASTFVTKLVIAEREGLIDALG